MAEKNETATFVDTVKEFLKDDVECHFNWELERFDLKFEALKRFEAKLRDKDLILETPFIHKWALKLSHGYEMFKSNQKSGLEIVKAAVEEMESTDDGLFVTYKTAFRHVACSLLATMLLQTEWDTDQLCDLIPKVVVLDKMSDNDKSGVLGLKANVLRWYGSDGTRAAIPVITEASRLCPEEFEWKISRVITLSRMRHFNRRQVITYADVAEPMEILTELIRSKHVIGDQEVICKYFLAVIHRDLLVMQNGDPEQTKRSNLELERLCGEILRSRTTSPQIVSFCAQRLARNGKLRSAISMTEKALEVFPRHIGLNTSISALYKRDRQFDKVGYHSKFAMEEGGYGAAWIYLEYTVQSRIRMNFDEFFNKLLIQHPSTFTAQTHVNASLFYYFKHHDIPKGSYHIVSALETDPSFPDLTDSFCSWIKKRVNPLEIAYNQICIYQRKAPSGSLEDIRVKISISTDVTVFSTSRDLVTDMTNESWREMKAMRRKKSVNSSTT